MESLSRLVFVFLLIISLSCCSGYEKKWNKVSNWNNPENWDKGRLPCVGDTIKLSDGAIFIDQSLTVGGFELPTNSEIEIGEGSELIFEDPTTIPNNQCPNQDMFFLGNQFKEWLNPFNWDLIESGVRSRYTDGMLYTDRVPCKNDQVSFPAGDHFAARVDQSSSVSQLELSAGSLSNAEAQSYFASREGSHRFSFANGAVLTVKESVCPYVQGCACGTTALKDAICQKFQCPAACSNSVKPDGDCCSRCGALIKMHTSQGFEISGCENELRNTISTAGYMDVLLVISPVDRQTSSEVQILLTDPQGKNSQEIGKKIFADLNKQEDSSKCKGYDILFFPTEGSTGTNTDDDDNKSTIALAVVLTLVLLAIIVVLIFFVWRRARNGSFAVKRNVLHNEMNVAGVQELDYVESQFDGNQGQGKGGSYENPVYNEMGYPGSTPAGAAAAPIPAKTPATNGVKSIDNPMYDKEILWNLGGTSPGGSSVASSRRAICIPRRSSWINNIDLDDARSDTTAEPGHTNPLYNDLYGDEKLPAYDEEDDNEKHLEDSDDETPEMMKAKLKIELDEEEDDEGKKKGSSDA